MKLKTQTNFLNNIQRYIQNYYPYILFFILMLFIHLFMGFHGDDIRFSKFLSNGSIIEFIFERYNTWSQRVVIECVLIFLTKLNIIVW